MSTDAQLDFLLGRTVGPIVRRLLPNDATLCLWSPTILTGIYVTVEDRYVSTMRLHCCSQAKFSMIYKEEAVNGWDFR